MNSFQLFRACFKVLSLHKKGQSHVVCGCPLCVPVVQKTRDLSGEPSDVGKED